MPRLFLVFLLIYCTRTNAQFADAGSGVLKQQIWWFDFNGFNPVNGASKTFTTTEGLTITIACSNVTGQTLFPNVMNTWPGAVLHVLYNFSDPSIKPALQSPQNNLSSHLTFTITATRNGMPAPFTFIIADAEASTVDELTKVHTTGSPWRTLEFFRNSSQTTNPVSGCNTSDIIISDTYGNAPVTGQNPIAATNAGFTGKLDVDVTMEKKVFGGMAIAMGIFAPVDRGDLPAAYGYVQHGLTFTSINPCNYLNPLPSIAQAQSLKLGALPGDADGQQTNNDNSNGADEDAISVFPAYDASGSYSVDIPITNASGANSFLSGWFDFDNSGTFTANEFASATIVPGTTSVKLSWNNLPVVWPVSQNFAFRFRYSSDQTSILLPAGYSTDGEVEDYLIPISCVLKLSGASDLSLCEGKQFQFNISGADNYSWSPSSGLNADNINNPTTNTTQNTTYVVTGTKGGCKGTDTIQVSVVLKPVFAVSPSATSACKNDLVSFTASGGDSYQWFDASGSPLGTTSALSVTATSATSYSAIIKSSGCQVTDTLDVNLTVNDLPIVALSKSNDIDCSSGNATLHASGGVNYVWNTAPDISNPTISNPVVSPKQTKTYTVTAKDANGCIAKDSITVNVDFTKGQANYLMPNAFTPNGDGKNDCFGLKYSSGVTAFDLSIFDRTGALLFRTTDPSACWNGTHKGLPLNSGTYVYQMKIAGTCSDGYSKGTVVLLR